MLKLLCYVREARLRSSIEEALQEEVLAGGEVLFAGHLDQLSELLAQEEPDLLLWDLGGGELAFLALEKRISAASVEQLRAALRPFLAPTEVRPLPPL